MFKRIIPLDEVKDNGYYDELVELAVIFNHEIVEDARGTWRWKTNTLMDYIHGDAPFYEGTEYRGNNTKTYRGSLDLNALRIDLIRRRFTLEEYMKFYMGIGYSLSGFYEVFGQDEAADWGVADAKKPENKPDEYTQTVIDYMCEKYRGQVLKI